MDNMYKEQISRNFLGINDSTLREGEQYNGSEFSLDDQIAILNYLHLIGVDTAEVGNPIVPAISEDLKVLLALTNRPTIMAHIRNKASDLEAALSVGVGGVHILCTADPSRLEQMSVTLDDHISSMIQNVQRAQSCNLSIRVSVEHGLEARFFADALRILKAAATLGIDRIQIADTRGVMMPWEVSQAIIDLRRDISIPIGVHLHNDLGHAASNALQALAAGANWVDTTLLGVGERTGITPLSTLLVNLYKIDPDITKKYSLACLTMAERGMAQILGMEVPHNLITGPCAFSHKAGIHINGLLKQGVDTYEPIPPELLGNQRVFVTKSRISGGINSGQVSHLET
jgi:homocitrate synthase